jgi:hypothetical protein
VHGASYHLAVLGDHLGGLCAAALASRRGQRVLLLETQEAGAARPLELLNAIAAGPEVEPGLGRLFQELGRAPFGPLGDDWIHFRALDPPLQVCLARHRLACPPERTARAWELQREFGDAHRLLAPLWQREEEFRERLEKLGAQQAAGAGTSLPARAIAGVSAFIRLQSLEREAAHPGFGEYLAGLTLPAELEAALAAQAQAASRRPPDGLTWAQGLRALRVAQGGLFRNAAGQRGVLAGLREAFVATGGDARPLVALEGIECPRVGGVRLHLAAGGAVRADRVVVDLPLEEGLRLLPPETVRQLERKGVAEREEFDYGLLECGLVPERRPEGMGDYIVIAPPEEGPAGPAVLLAAAAPEPGTREGACAVEALAFFPAGSGAAGRGYVLERVRSVLPFLDESLAGEPSYRVGTAARWLRERLSRAQREERLAAGWGTSVFREGAFTFLRNESYSSVGLAEGLLSGALALA